MNIPERSSNDSLLKNEVLKQIYFEQPISCPDLSEAIGKSIPVVTKVISELLEAGSIIENGYAASKGGRRPIVYSLSPNQIFIVSVAMDQLYTKITILDGHHNIILPAETIHLPLLANPEAISSLVNIINDAIGRSGIDRSKIVGVGIGMPGFVNAKLGINHSYLKPAKGLNLRSFLELTLQLPVHVDNDSSIIALAELKFGCAKNRQDVMVINIGWGIGLGMIVNGELFRGHRGYAGEFSHIPLTDNDTLCDCGKRGCLETEATLRVVASRAVEYIKEGKISNMKLKDNAEEMCEEVIAAAIHGDQVAVELFSDMSYKIGKGIAILIHIINPELIILSGRGAEAGKMLLAPIQQAINKYCIPRLAEYTEVTVSKMGQDAYTKGIAALVMENLGAQVFQA